MSEVINRSSKDRLFRFIFGRPENKVWTLSLYNAVNGSHYTDPDALEITTIEDALYMSMKNDLSFLIADTINFYEHQASVNPNMPIRMLIYAGMVYSKYVEDERNHINLYSSRQQMLPAPKLVCFYNGLQEQPDRTVLRLQSAFPQGAEADIAANVTMLNINYGRNRALMDMSRPLNDYAVFVQNFRQKVSAGMSADDSAAAAIDELPDDSPIKGFLLSNKAEVKRMCITEYDEVRNMNMLREEARAEGRAEGMEKGMEKGESKLGALIDRLLSLGRNSDVARAATDSEYRQQLYKEFQIA